MSEVDRYSQKHYKKKKVTRFAIFVILTIAFYFISFYFFWLFLASLNQAVNFAELSDANFLLAVTFLIAGLMTMIPAIDAGWDMVGDFLRGRALLRHMKKYKKERE